MRRPLPYAFARTHQLLLEDDAGDLTLCLHPDPAQSAVAEVMRKYPVRQLQSLPVQALPNARHSVGTRLKSWAGPSNASTRLKTVGSCAAAQTSARIAPTGLIPLV